MNIKGSNSCKLQRQSRGTSKAVRIHYLCVLSSVKHKGEWVIHQGRYCPTALDGSCKLSAARFKIQALHGISTMSRIWFSWIECKWALKIQVTSKSSCSSWRKMNSIQSVLVCNIYELSLSVTSVLYAFGSQLLSSQVVQRTPIPSGHTLCFL